MPRTKHTIDPEDDRDREIDQLKADKNRLEHEVDRLKQRERTPPRHDPRPQGGGFDGGWMGW